MNENMKKYVRRVCPFCGNPNIFAKWESGHNSVTMDGVKYIPTIYWVECDSCKARGPLFSSSLNNDLDESCEEVYEHFFKYFGM